MCGVLDLLFLVTSTSNNSCVLCGHVWLHKPLLLLDNRIYNEHELEWHGMSEKQLLLDTHVCFTLNVRA